MIWYKCMNFYTYTWYYQCAWCWWWCCWVSCRKCNNMSDKRMEELIWERKVFYKERQSIFTGSVCRYINSWWPWSVISIITIYIISITTNLNMNIFHIIILIVNVILQRAHGDYLSVSGLAVLWGAPSTTIDLQCHIRQYYLENLPPFLSFCFYNSIYLWYLLLYFFISIFCSA